MATTTKVTKAQAEQVMAEVREFHRHILSDGGEGDLRLVQGWDYPDQPRDWAIVWEEGPYAWAYEFTRHHNAMPDRPFTEPYDGWAICIYPA